MSIKRDYDCFLLYFVEEQLVLITHFPSYSKTRYTLYKKKGNRNISTKDGTWKKISDYLGA